MISVDDALKLVLKNLPQVRTEKVSFQSALGCVVAEDILANSNVPSFRRAAMDGFALRAADVEKVPARLRCVGQIRAGGGSTTPVRPGEAVSIMTGAPVPDGADAVQMVELTERAPNGNEIVVLKPVKSGENITPLGFETALGDVVLEAGRRIGPAELAVLATFGYSQVLVFAKPRVAVIATGDELVEVEELPRPDQIRNSNAYSICGQLRQMGLEAEYLGIARDQKESLKQLMLEGLRRDVLILTGGVSMGEYDLVEEVFEELHLEIFFSKVAMKPGKPTVFARKDNAVVFGLPGNPVSSFVSFENFVRPAVGRLCGLTNPHLPRIKGELLQDMKQKPGRTAFLPAWVAWEEGKWTIEPLGWKGSGDIVGFSRANATVIFPDDRDCMRRGEVVEAMLLPDYPWRTRRR